MQKYYIYIVAAAHLACDINAGAIPALLPFFVSYYDMDYKSVAGFMFAASFLSTFIQPLFGYLADKTPRRWFMSFGIMLSGISMGVIGFVSDYWLIFLAIAVSGVGGSIFHPEAARLINKISGRRQGTGISIFSVGGNAGFAIGPLIVVAAIMAFDMPGLLIFTAIGAVMAALLLVVVPKIQQSITDDDKEAAADNLKNGVLVQPGINDWVSFIKLVLVIVFRSVVFCGLNSFIPLYWIHVMGQSEASGSTALTVLFTLGVVTTMIGGIIADRFGYIRTVKYCSVLLVPLQLWFACNTNIWVALMLLAPMGFALFAPYSSIVVLGQKYLAKNIGFASGITLGISFSVGGMLAPLLGWFADANGLTAVMYLITGLAFISAVCTFWLPKPVAVTAQQPTTDK